MAEKELKGLIYDYLLVARFHHLKTERLHYLILGSGLDMRIEYIIGTEALVIASFSYTAMLEEKARKWQREFDPSMEYTIVQKDSNSLQRIVAGGHPTTVLQGYLANLAKGMDWESRNRRLDEVDHAEPHATDALTVYLETEEDDGDKYAKCHVSHVDPSRGEASLLFLTGPLQGDAVVERLDAIQPEWLEGMLEY